MKIKFINPAHIAALGYGKQKVFYQLSCGTIIAERFKDESEAKDKLESVALMIK